MRGVLIVGTSMLMMMAWLTGFLGMFMTRRVPGSLSEFSRDSTKPTKMIAGQENNFCKDCEKLYSPRKLLRDTFESITLNQIKHSRRENLECQEHQNLYAHILYQHQIIYVCRPTAIRASVLDCLVTL